VYLAVKDEPFFQPLINAMGRLQAHPLQKVVAEFRVIAYGGATDRADGYARLSGTVKLESTKLLMEFIVKRWGSPCLRRPNKEVRKTIMERKEERGTPVCMGSLHCFHWEWHQCQTGMAGAYHSRKGQRGIFIEAVCYEDLWVSYLLVGAPTSLNDIDVIQQKPLYLDAARGRSPPRNHPYTINGNTSRLPNYIIDGIYPRFSFLFSRAPNHLSRSTRRLNACKRPFARMLSGCLGSS